MSENNKVTPEQFKMVLDHINALIFRTYMSKDGSDIIDENIVVFDDHSGVSQLELGREVERLKNLVHKDELTGALNRRGFYNQFKQMFDEALFLKKNNKTKRNLEIKDFSLIFIDGDNFKAINDTYGHAEGDAVLKTLSSTLKKNVRDIDGVARFGGEEFVVALVGADEDKAHEKAEEIRKILQKDVVIEKAPKNYVFTTSLGVASLGSSDADNIDELVSYADQAMYEAKSKKGKNNTVRFSKLRS